MENKYICYIKTSNNKRKYCLYSYVFYDSAISSISLKTYSIKLYYYLTNIPCLCFILQNNTLLHDKFSSVASISVSNMIFTLYSICSMDIYYIYFDSSVASVVLVSYLLQDMHHCHLLWYIYTKCNTTVSLLLKTTDRENTKY